jgi:hypothetical protein
LRNPRIVFAITARLTSGDRPRTFAGYEAAITHHISPELGRVRLAKLTPQQLQAWLGSPLAVDGTRAWCCGRR